jgi:hypothetical protein
MLNSCRRISLMLLAAALTFFAVGAAQAQDSNDTSRTTQAPTETSPLSVQQSSTQDTQSGSSSQTPQSGNTTQTQNKPTPLTADEKIKSSFKHAFLNPLPYMTSAMSAGLTQFGEDRLPHKDGGDEVADWGSRSARNFATKSTTTLFASGFYPALFKQDPRYEPSQRKGFARRALHAVSRVFVTRDDDGNLEPNYSRFAGVATASALSNIWEHSTPGHDRIGKDATIRRFGRSFITGSINNIVFKEFWPDIMKIFGR